ncbi:MAG: response regulator transcription factor [Phycisphaerales bacterium]|nr:response regulator transcription factor [Phycisphaerales bacterium]
MIRQRILVIEDDPAIRRGVTDALRFEGYQISEAGRADTGLAAALTGDADIVLLDLVMPGGDGLDVLHEIRRQRPTLPVIILTARGEEADRVRGLRLGADDYVVKPFSVRELLARVTAVLRRSPERPSPLQQIAIPGGVVDLPRLEVRFDDGQRGELSEKEGELLAYLASHDGRVLSREEILTRLWRLDARGVETRTIDMHVARLREKLRDDPHAPRVIVTVRGRGYKFGAVALRE